MAKLEPLWLHLHGMAERMGEASSLAVATDYDGTVTPIVSHPGEAELPARARRALETLAGVKGARVMVLSGRALDDLRKQIGVQGVALCGNAGLESENEQGEREMHVPPGKEVPVSLRTELEAWCQRFPGAWLEDKGHSVALHYRNVPQRFQGAFGAGVRRRARPHRGAATLVHGKKVFEVMPAISWNKADALERWWDNRGMLFFFGDDTNDEPVHARVSEKGGTAVAVGRVVSKAGYALRGPNEVVWFLEWLSREWQERHAALGD